MKIQKEADRLTPSGDRSLRGAQFIVSSLPLPLPPTPTPNSHLLLVCSVLCLICSDSVKKLNQQKMRLPQIYLLSTIVWQVEEEESYNFARDIQYEVRPLTLPLSLDMKYVCGDTKVCFECEFHL